MLIHRTPSLIVAAALGAAAQLAAAADCNRNGLDDFAEVESGAEVDCDGNGVPDSCDILPVNQGLAFHTGLEAGPDNGFASAIAAGDMDRDGHGDLAVLVLGERVSVLWGEGGGNFSAPSRFDLRQMCNTLVAGDLNGDGHMDLAGGGQDGLVILFQLGERRFTSSPSFLPMASTRGAFALGDLDGDAGLDIAFAGRFEVFIVPANGDGTFSEPRVLPAGSGPIHIAAADIDGDGDIDLATANSLINSPTTVSVFLNQGRAIFSPARNYAIRGHPSNIMAGDIDGAGRADLLITSAGLASISILLAREDGKLAAITPFATGRTPLATALLDLDRDGDLDVPISRQLDVADPVAGGAIMLFFNVEIGIFHRGHEIEVEGKPVSLAPFDLFRGEPLEVAVLDGRTGDIDIFVDTFIPYHPDCDLNGVPDVCDSVTTDCNGNGFTDVCDVRAGRSRDCDRDGIPDECEPDCNGNLVPDACEVSSRRTLDCNGNGVPDECDLTRGSFRFEVTSAGWAILSMMDLDLDGDGLTDIVGLDLSGRLVVSWSGPEGALEPPAILASAATGSPLAAGDLDGDGDIDIAAGDGESRAIRLVLQSGPRVFSPGLEIALGEPAGSIAAADLDGDGAAEVAAVDASGDVLIFGGDGAVRPPGSIPAGADPGFLATRDIDGDGAGDIACIASGGAPAVLWNRGSGAFSGPEALPSRLPVRTPLLHDIDRDGDLDLAAREGEDVLAFLQAGPREFERIGLFRSADLAALAVADTDRDGLNDLVSAHRGPARLEVRRNDGEGALMAPHVLPAPAGLDGIIASDLDRNGSADIAAAFQDTPCPQCPSVGRLLVWWNQTIPPSSLDLDGNGRPDECDRGAFRRGDADGDGALDLTDAVFTLRALFQGEPAPGCMEAADADNDGSVSLTDAVSILEFLFRGGAPPPAPGPPPGPCGLDTDTAGSPGALGCATYTSC